MQPPGSSNRAAELVAVRHPPGRRARLSGLCLERRHPPKLGGGPTGTKGRRTSHGGAGGPALPSAAPGNVRARPRGGAHFAWPLCGTPPPPRTWGLSRAGWGWGPWAASLGASPGGRSRTQPAGREPLGLHCSPSPRAGRRRDPRHGQRHPRPSPARSGRSPRRGPGSEPLLLRPLLAPARGPFKNPARRWARGRT